MHLQSVFKFAGKLTEHLISKGISMPQNSLTMKTEADFPPLAAKCNRRGSGSGNAAFQRFARDRQNHSFNRDKDRTQ